MKIDSNDNSPQKDLNFQSDIPSILPSINTQENQFNHPQNFSTEK